MPILYKSKLFDKKMKKSPQLQPKEQHIIYNHQFKFNQLNKNKKLRLKVNKLKNKLINLK